MILSAVNHVTTACALTDTKFDDLILADQVFQTLAESTEILYQKLSEEA